MGIFDRVLRALSGNGYIGDFQKQRVLNKVIGFRGLGTGCGTSTIVQNVVHVLAENTNLSICVIDLNMLYPVQQQLLGASSSRIDIMDYDKDIAKVTASTRYKSVSLVNYKNRTVLDMLGDKDKSDTFELLLKDLKNFFDLIIIDLSLDKTNVATTAAVKCNYIYTVTDMALKNIYHLRTSLNTSATLAVSVEKQRKTIVNKAILDVASGVEESLTDAGLEVIAKAVYCPEVAKRGINGKMIYTNDVELDTHSMFNDMIESVAKDVVQGAPDPKVVENLYRKLKTTTTQEEGKSKIKKEVKPKQIKPTKQKGTKQKQQPRLEEDVELETDTLLDDFEIVEVGVQQEEFEPLDMVEDNQSSGFGSLFDGLPEEEEEDYDTSQQQQPNMSEQEQPQQNQQNGTRETVPSRQVDLFGD